MKKNATIYTTELGNFVTFTRRDDNGAIYATMKTKEGRPMHDGEEVPLSHGGRPYLYFRDHANAGAYTTKRKATFATNKTPHGTLYGLQYDQPAGAVVVIAQENDRRPERVCVAMEHEKSVIYAWFERADLARVPQLPRRALRASIVATLAALTLLAGFTGCQPEHDAAARALDVAEAAQL